MLRDNVTIYSSWSGVNKIVLLLDHRRLVSSLLEYKSRVQDTVQDRIVLNKVTIRGGHVWSVNLHKLLPHGSAISNTSLTLTNTSESEQKLKIK